MRHLNRDEKAEVIAEVERRLEQTTTIVAAEYRGLSVKQMSVLRTALREADAEFTVVKNTLARRAADAKGVEGLGKYLTGPVGLVWVNGDPAAAAKALSTFSTANPALNITGGLLDGADIDTAGLGRLAKLPSRDVLLAQLAGGVAAPLRNLAGGMQNLITGLAQRLAAVQAKKAEEGPSEAAAPASEAPASEAPAEEAPAADAEAPAEEAPAAPASEAPAEEAPAAEAEAPAESGEAASDPEPA
ncbi:MAG: 50S ribosomal protein L10 [Thermoleophilia bacterium]|nr:50S ribosomal protein L10 [Thermoleophilia bacterium]